MQFLSIGSFCEFITLRVCEKNWQIAIGFCIFCIKVVLQNGCTAVIFTESNLCHDLPSILHIQARKMGFVNCLREDFILIRILFVFSIKKFKK